MDLGVYRREHLQSGNPELLGAATVEQFQRTHAAIGVWQEVEHTHDGHHTDIHADSIDIAGDAVIHGDLAVDDLTVGGDLLVAGDAIIDGHVEAETLFVTGAAAVSGPLSVGGTTTLNADLHVGGHAYVDGSVIVGRDEVVNGYLQLQSALPILRFVETDQPANLQRFRILGNQQFLIFDAINDAESVASGTIYMNRGGDLVASRDYYEKNRTVPMGHWQDVPFSPANFTASAGMTWTVGAPAVVRNRYAIIGKTLTWSVYLSWFSGSNVIGGVAGTTLGITLPGMNFAGGTVFAIDYQQNVAGVPILAGIQGAFSGNQIQLTKPDGSNFAVGTAPGFIFTVTGEIL